MIDLRARDRSQLIGLLAREDLELIEHLGGRRRDDLQRAHRQAQLSPGGSLAPAVCVHDLFFPRRLRYPGGPRLLYTDGDASLLRPESDRPTAALLGTSRPSAYGAEMARSLAYGLACGGTIVVTLLADGVALAARAGAERAGSGAVVVSTSGLELDRSVGPGARGSRARPRSCLVGELPPGCPGRRWGQLAAERTAVELSDLVLVVETEPGAQPFGVELARESPGRIAAVPGRATAPLAQGPLALLRDGASLVRCADDALELLGLPTAGPQPDGVGAGLLPARQARLLERVGSGQETPEQLLSGADRRETLLGLAGLELMGHVRRTHDGRYIAAAGGGSRR